MAAAKGRKAVAAVKRSTRRKQINTITVTRSDNQIQPESSRNGNATERDAEMIVPVDEPDNTARNREMAELLKEVSAMKAALGKEQMRNTELQKQINNMTNGQKGDGVKMITRPSGSAGTDFSIQMAMGLAGSAKKYETYKAIQRNLRDLAMNARINWEVPWAQVPARDKAKLFEVARDQHPFLARFERDWATEEIVKQFVKNKRKNHYANGWLEVPERYAYLKQNSLKRNPAAPRTKKSLKGSTNNTIGSAEDPEGQRDGQTTRENNEVA